MSIFEPNNSGTVAFTNASPAIVGVGTTFTSYRAGSIVNIPGLGSMQLASDPATDTAAVGVVAWQGADTGAKPFVYEPRNEQGVFSQKLTALLNELSNGNVQALIGLDGTEGQIPMFTGPGTLTSVPKNDLVAGAVPPQGRLSLVSGVALAESDVIGATAIYYVPATGRLVPLYDGTAFVAHLLPGQLSLNLDADTGHTNYHADYENYDLFVFSDGGTLRLGSGPRWQNGAVAGDDNNRGTGAGSTEIEVVDGLYVNKNSILLRIGSGSGDTVTVPAQEATYVGSFTPIGHGLATDSERRRMVFNAFNQTVRSLYTTDLTVTWTYSTATWRRANNTSANQVEFLLGLAGSAVEATATGFVQNSTSTPRTVETGIGLDALTPSARSVSGRRWAVSGQSSTQSARYVGSPGLGRHALIWLEKGGGTDTQTWFGTDAGNYAVGIVGSLVS